MADTPINGETVTPGDSQTTGTPAATPVVNADPAEVERLRKESDQAKMDAANSRNELAKMKADQEAAQRKQLEEKEEYKTLFEKADAELKAAREAREADEKLRTLSTETDSVFKDYPANVVDVAKTAGISLTDDSEAARTSLKEKLDAIKDKVGTTSTVTASNPSNPAAETRDYRTLTAPPEGDGRRGWEASPLAMEGATGSKNSPVFKEYVKGHPSISNALKTMRQNAGIKVEE